VRRALLALLPLIAAAAPGAVPADASARVPPATTVAPQVAPAMPATPPPVPPLKRCVGRAFTPSPREAWIHTHTPLAIVAQGAPNHSMQDVVATSGAGASIRGKFSYGPVSKDLEDEKVRVFLDGCSGWTRLGDFRTDADGRIAVPVPPSLGPGVYDVGLEVLGDGSTAAGRVWLLPAGTRIAVSDIDGTLTTADEEFVRDVFTDLFHPISSGSYVPKAYPGAAALTNALAARGYVVVFLTGRPYWLTGKTRAWLAGGGFAEGPVHVTDTNGEAIPSAGGVGAFKVGYLRSLAAAGFRLEEAYGNATTDVSAYAGAGIPPASTWIIGPNGGASGTNAVMGSWEPRVAEIAKLPPVVQPFTGSAR
jgi:phosphatidate phosphatase PAH1